jgi:ribokinase
MNTNGQRVLAIGAASQDVFLTGKPLAAKRDVRTHSYIEQFPLGAKIELDAVFFDIGGGGTNAAVTFARQGFETGFIGKIGHDPAGAEVLRVLRRENISTDHMAYDTKLGTQYSSILLAPNGERTILIYRGASHEMKANDFSVRTFAADWFYISSLAGNLDFLSKILTHANNHGIKVAFNPGAAELTQVKKMKRLLPLINVLMANREEYQKLFMTGEPKLALKQAVQFVDVAVLTDGAKGSYVADNDKLYSAGQYQKVKAVDRTGAGDAYNSGFVAALAKGLSIEDAMTLGSANSTSVVTKIGAKPGILKTSKLKRMKIKVTNL